MRVWVVEECRHCPACEVVTPHSRRRLAPLLVLSAILALVGAGSCWLGGPALAAGILALVVAVLVFSLDRRSCWRIACERCRWKRVRRDRWRMPDPRSTEIGV